MNKGTAEKLGSILKGEKEPQNYVEDILSEIYSEVNQMKQKQDEIFEVLKEWQLKK